MGRLLALLESSPAGLDFQARLNQAPGRLDRRDGRDGLDEPNGASHASTLDVTLSDGRHRLRLRPLEALGSSPAAVAVQWDRLSHPELRLLTLARQASLRRRELQVAQGLLRGDSNEAIARHLGVAESTLKTLSRSLYQRLQVEDRQGFWRKLAAF